AERIAKMEEELKRLTKDLQKSEGERKDLAETLQKNEVLLKTCKTACDGPAEGFRETFKQKNAAIDMQREPQTKRDMIKELGEYLDTVDHDFDSALTKFNAQIEIKAAEVRGFRRILDAKTEEVNKRIAEVEEPLSDEEGEFVLAIRECSE
ncbi:MAG: hypothetical protein P4L69_04280, partial [Desulfosporosinus sp.]|nr:hypothetical protein [Desulfosporosinus sp.]